MTPYEEGYEAGWRECARNNPYGDSSEIQQWEKEWEKGYLDGRTEMWKWAGDQVARLHTKEPHR